MVEPASEKRGIRNLFMNNLERIVKAVIVTLVVGVVLLVLWILLSALLAPAPQYISLFSGLIWATLFFTFADRVTVGTIYQYCFKIARAFFLIFFISYGSNFGLLRLDLPGVRVTAQVVPLLGLIVFVNILDIGRNVLQVIQLKSYSPID